MVGLGRALTNGAELDGAVSAVDTSKLIAVATALLCLAANALFFLVPHAPLVDVPNHAARLMVECSAADPELSRMYAVHWGLIPNLAGDLLLPPLCGFASPWHLVVGMIVASNLLIAASVMALHKHFFGRWHASLLIVPALSLSLPSMMGYSNYLFGVALAFASFAVLVRWNPRNLPALITFGTVIGTLLFFSHIFSLLLMMLMTAGWFWTGRGEQPSVAGAVRAGLTAMLCFAIPLMLALYAQSGSPEGGVAWGGKVRLAIAVFYPGDANTAIFMTIVLAGLLILLARRGAVHIAPSMRGPLIALGLFVVIAPSSLRDAVDIDSRLLLPLAMLFLASARISYPTPALGVVCAGAALSLPVSIAAALVSIWVPFSKQVDQLREALVGVPAGAPVLSIINEAGPFPTRVGNVNLPYFHLASYALLDRRAFNPLQFTASSMQPLAAVGDYRSVDVGVGQPLSASLAEAACRDPLPAPKLLTQNTYAYTRKWCRKFPYVLYMHFGSPEPLGARLDQVAAGTYFTLFRVPGAPDFSHDRTGPLTRH